MPGVEKERHIARLQRSAKSNDRVLHLVQIQIGLFGDGEVQPGKRGGEIVGIIRGIAQIERFFIRAIADDERVVFLSRGILLMGISTRFIVKKFLFCRRRL